MHYILWHDLKVVYHCFSCKKDFVDIDLAKEHSKSLRHEVTEETQRSGNDDQLFLV
jgi:DNA-directed RNA polymerase subunit RPC12/RpoP